MTLSKSSSNGSFTEDDARIQQYLSNMNQQAYLLQVVKKVRRSFLEAVPSEEDCCHLEENEVDEMTQRIGESLMAHHYEPFSKSSSASSLSSMKSSASSEDESRRHHIEEKFFKWVVRPDGAPRVHRYLTLGSGGLRPNAVCNADGESALMKAARHGCAATVAVLLDFASSPSNSSALPLLDQVDSHGANALMHAAIGGDRTCVELLLAAASASDHRTGGSGHNKYRDACLPSNGWTALHLAASCGQAQTAVHLVEAGADVDLKDHEGKTALDIAAARGHADAVDILRSSSKRWRPVGGGDSLSEQDHRRRESSRGEAARRKALARELPNEPKGPAPMPMRFLGLCAQ